jgi:hypothetical protein
MIPAIAIVTVLVIAGWVVYYFQFSDHATTRLVERLLHEPLPSHKLHSEFRAIVTGDGVACEHPHRPREFIRWTDVQQILLRRTDGGPWLADLWVLFVGESGGCSVPTEARNFDAVMRSFERFPKFDHSCFLRGDSNDTQYVCWRSDDHGA